MLLELKTLFFVRKGGLKRLFEIKCKKKDSQLAVYFFNLPKLNVSEVVDDY